MIFDCLLEAIDERKRVRQRGSAASVRRVLVVRADEHGRPRWVSAFVVEVQAS